MVFIIMNLGDSNSHIRILHGDEPIGNWHFQLFLVND